MRGSVVAAALALAGCGARTELNTPRADEVSPGAAPAYCKGQGDTAVFVITLARELFRFDPPAASFTAIGKVDCPVAASGTTPFSMAVDHQGVAYVVYDDGELFLVDTRTGVCALPGSPIDTTGFSPTFGMGFSADPGGATETLYLVSDASRGVLGKLDTSSFAVTRVAELDQVIGPAELTGTGDGRLFGFGVNQGIGTTLAEIDTASARVESTTPIPASPDTNAWAFAFWSGDFYFFTSADQATSAVGRYHPDDGSFEPEVATLGGGAIVGAGVSTCAPR